jgi:hypothetical protein
MHVGAQTGAAETAMFPGDQPLFLKTFVESVDDRLQLQIRYSNNPMHVPQMGFKDGV